MDQKQLVYKGCPPDHCCCDATLRILPDGEFAVFFLTGGPIEPDIDNHVAMCRSTEPGVVWTKELETVLRFNDRACLLSEAYVDAAAGVRAEPLCRVLGRLVPALPEL
jgi:hypothetical protein